MNIYIYITIIKKNHENNIIYFIYYYTFIYIYFLILLLKKGQYRKFNFCQSRYITFTRWMA